MVTFEESRAKKRTSSRNSNSRTGGRKEFGSRDSRDRKPRRDSGRSNFGDRKPAYGNRPRTSGRNPEMTRVKCSLCGVDCEVPFKPTSSKPVYCDSCFAKKGAATASKISENDLDIINAKLNKIMKALNIE